MIVDSKTTVLTRVSRVVGGVRVVLGLMGGNSGVALRGFWAGNCSVR